MVVTEIDSRHVARHIVSMLTTRISRRHLLRSAALGGTGLAAAYLLGCSDGNGGNGGGATSTAPLPSPVSGTPAQPTTLQWTMVTPAGDAPSARRDHSLVSDGERLVLFGGRGSDPLADTWVDAIAPNSWGLVHTDIALPPPARFGHNAVWHGASARMIVFGGQADDGSFYNDLWAFDLASGWSQLDTGSGPSQRYGAASALDPEGRLVITHGFTDQGRFDDTWRYDFSAQAWEEISPAGERPIERCLMRAVWTEVQDKHLLMFGGQTTSTPFLDDLWALEEGRGWVPVERVPSPPARNLYSMVYDQANDKITMFGGNTESGPVAELWWFDAADEFWANPPLLGPAPPARFGHDAAWVAPRSAMFVFGGNDGSADLSELWVLGPAQA